MSHGQAQCPEGLKKDYTGVDGWPCQPISLSLKLRNWLQGTLKSFRGYFRNFPLASISEKTRLIDIFIKMGAFEGCYSLETITLPSSMTLIYNSATLYVPSGSRLYQISDISFYFEGIW
jgi:hypothetical protein